MLFPVSLKPYSQSVTIYNKKKKAVTLSKVLFLLLNKVVPTFKSVDVCKCDHSNESYWAVLSCGTVYCAVESGSNF